MLEAREINILRHALSTRPGAVAERLARRLDGDAFAASSLPADERAEGAEALDAYAAGHAGFGHLAVEVARQLRAER